MQHILGIILRNSDVEIMEDESPGKGSYMGLTAVMNDARKMILQNHNIKQINIYRIIQGQRILDQRIFSKIETTENSK
jgi:hypothetical protein